MSPDPLSMSLRVFRHLLRFYPPQFRSDYGDEMLHLFRSVARDEYAQGGARSLTALWLRTIPDLVVSAAEEYLQEGGTTMRSYLVRGSALGGLAGGAMLIVYGLLANLEISGAVDRPLGAVDDMWLAWWGILLFAACLGGFYLGQAHRWNLGTKISCLLTVAGAVWAPMWFLITNGFLGFLAGYYVMIAGLMLTGLLLLFQRGMRLLAGLLFSIGVSFGGFNTEDASVLLATLAGILILAFAVFLVKGVPQGQNEPPLAA